MIKKQSKHPSAFGNAVDFYFSKKLKVFMNLFKCYFGDTRSHFGGKVKKLDTRFYTTLKDYQIGSFLDRQFVR